MATLIPSLNSCLSRMTSGEKRVARALESNLDRDYLLWYDVPIGSKHRSVGDGVRSVFCLCEVIRKCSGPVKIPTAL